MTRVGRPPVVQKETRGDSGEVARPSCSGKRGSVEECGWQLVRGRARPARARNSVGARRCCLFVKLAKYETWCFPSILVNIVKLNNILCSGRLIVQGVSPPFILCNCVLHV